MGKKDVVLHVKMTIKYPSNHPDLVRPFYPVHWMREGECREGFEKGSLKKTTFELENGHTIIYEAIERI